MQKVVKYGFANRYPLRRMMVRWFDKLGVYAVAFSETQRLYFIEKTL